MSDANANPTGAAANAAPPATNQSAPSAAPAPTKPKYEIDYDPNNPPWLSDRLTRERQTAAKEAEANARKALLAELGFDDPEMAKKLAAEEKKRQEAQKSLETKLAERDTKLSSAEERLKELGSSVKVFADEQIATLSETQRKAVLDLAGEDPARQLRAIATLRPTWATVTTQQSQTSSQGSQATNAQPETPKTQQQSPPAATQKPAPATGPGPTAPSPAGDVVVPNHLEIYEMLNDPASPDYKPFAAAQYLLAYSREIEAARKIRGSA